MLRYPFLILPFLCCSSLLLRFLARLHVWICMLSVLVRFHFILGPSLSLVWTRVHLLGIKAKTLPGAFRFEATSKRKICFILAYNSSHVFVLEILGFDVNWLTWEQNFVVLEVAGRSFMLTLVRSLQDDAGPQANVCLILFLDRVLVDRLASRRNKTLAGLNGRARARTLLMNCSRRFLRFIQFTNFGRVHRISFHRFEVHVNQRRLHLQLAVVRFVPRRFHQGLAGLAQLVSLLDHAGLARCVNLPWHAFISLV